MRFESMTLRDRRTRTPGRRKLGGSCFSPPGRDGSAWEKGRAIFSPDAQNNFTPAAGGLSVICAAARGDDRKRVESESGVIHRGRSEYTNPFVDVHRKAKAFKDHAREVNKNDAELRESRLVREAREILDKEPT